METIGSELFDFFREVQPKFYEDITDCKFMGEKMDCQQIFKPIITDEGLCYVFNLFDRNDLFRDNV